MFQPTLTGGACGALAGQSIFISIFEEVVGHNQPSF